MCNQTTCVYWYSYGDGSLTTGDFVYDTITMDGINDQKQQVGIHSHKLFRHLPILVTELLRSRKLELVIRIDLT